MCYLSRFKNKRGAVLVLVALSLFVLLGITALAIDLGRLYVAKQRAQNVADAAAIAGGAYLDGESTTFFAAVVPEVESVVRANNSALESWSVDMDTVTIEPKAVYDDNPYNGVQVSCSVGIDYGFARIFGGSASNARAKAVVARYIKILSLEAGPWWTKLSTLWNMSSTPPQSKYGPGNLLDPPPMVRMEADPGNFGAAAYGDDRGASHYRDFILGNSSITYLNLSSTVVRTEPGQMQGPTLQGLIDGFQGEPGRLDPSVEPYQPIVDPSTSEIITTAWDQWSNDFLSGNDKWMDTRRLVVIPVVEDKNYHGRSVLDVVGYAALFIEGVTADDGIICHFVASVINDDRSEGATYSAGWLEVFDAASGGMTESSRARLVE